MREIDVDNSTQWIDTGIKPSGKLFAARREPCSFCGWGNSVHVYSVKLSDANVEAELRYSDDGTLTVTDHKGKSFEMRLPYCPSCGKKKDGGGDNA